ncbi:MAG: hypothetical protein EBZ59_10760, partial [Planctomycetia bacterium]|nr:hypothetical protein [Planctomycetia bacterium]
FRATHAPVPESLRALVVRVQATRPPVSTAPPAAPEPQPRRIVAPVAVETIGAAPLPGEPWTDPDSVNWSDAPATAGTARGPRILERLRVGDRLLGRGRQFDAPMGPPTPEPEAAGQPVAPPDGGSWPKPTTLLHQLEQLVQASKSRAIPGPGGWAQRTLALLDTVLATRGPRDTSAGVPLVSLADEVNAGMSLADATPDTALSAHARRTALAVSRRVSVWRAAAAVLTEAAAGSGWDADGTDGDTSARRLGGDGLATGIARLLEGIERFENAPLPAEAAAVRCAVTAIEMTPHAGTRAVARSVADHYLAPNVRIAVHREFLEKLLPETTVDTDPVVDVVMGRKVRGTRTVERSTTVRFTPDPDEICFDLEVHGDVSSRTVTESGPVTIAARGASSFTVWKPVKVSTRGLAFGQANGVASNRSRLDNIQTSFDSVPVMRSLVRNIARNQHEESMPDVNREVIEKIVSRACREVDAQAEPKFNEIADRIRSRVWTPLERLGLEPTAVAMETTATVATVRIRLAADAQLAAHTPRPRAPSDSQLSLQVHESSINNACEQFGLAGRRMPLEELIRLICERLGLDPQVPDDLPEGVAVTFADVQPLRIECRDGLVHVRVALDALESGRRTWSDVLCRVAYRPTSTGPQVFLERDGPVQIGGRGHQGRMEIGLRTIFGKIFPKERPIPVLPPAIAGNPRLAGMRAVQTVSNDGWFALAIGSREAAATAGRGADSQPGIAGQRRLLFR